MGEVVVSLVCQPVSTMDQYPSVEKAFDFHLSQTSLNMKRLHCLLVYAGLTEIRVKPIDPAVPQLDGVFTPVL